MHFIPSLFLSILRRAVTSPRAFSTLRRHGWLPFLCGALVLMLSGAWSASSAQSATPTSTILTVISGGSAATTVPCANAPGGNAIAAVDLNGDGYLDYVIMESQFNEVFIYVYQPVLGCYQQEMPYWEPRRWGRASRD
jgi:hypothetical protein